MTRIAPLALAFSLVFLAACSGKGSGDGTRVEASGALWGQNLTLNATGQPKAEISAKGDFIVDGKAVPVTDAQRTLLVAYHRALGGIADAGIATGKEGAKLAGKAVGAAVKGLFSGNPDGIEQQIEAEAKKVEAEAMKICDHLPGLYKAQQDLVAALPAFQPYATMDANDIEDCRTNHDDSRQAGEEVGRAIGRAIKDDDAGAPDAAPEADAAPAKPATP